MARKTATITIEAEGRDAGKKFLITEMSAVQAEDWALRAILALATANVELPDGVLQSGMAGLVEMGLKKLFALSHAQAKPLLDELMECVQIFPDKKHSEVRRPLQETDVEEVKTLLSLKWEVAKLHVDFSFADDLFGSIGEAMAAAKITLNSPTSPKSSVSSSASA